MTEPRNYSPYQQKIIQRYYDNRDQLDEQKLSELVASLYLAEGKKKDKLWQQAEELMKRMKVREARIQHIMSSKNPSILAELVKDIAAGRST